jgi:UTP--glucose-1-phosphate uridylyltransferase
MRVQKAVITAAAPYQRTLALHTLIDCDGVEKPVLRIILGHVRSAGIDDVAVVVHPGDEDAYQDAAAEDGRHITFIPQRDARGYGHAVYCAREYVGSSDFLHVVGDHVYVCPGDRSCACGLVELAEAEHCAVSAVQATRETMIPDYGAVAGPRVAGRPNLYRIETVIEKPTPTEAEQRLVVTGLRAGHYLCFFGMHALTPTVFDVLGELLARGTGRVTLSEALAEVARREQYLAMVAVGRRYDLGVRYGFLTAQLALALAGRDSSAVLSRVLEVVASRQIESAGAGAHE